MAKYILVKKVKGKKYEYQVIDADSKAIVSKRTSAREYVAFGEYTADVIQTIVEQTGYYGEIYRYCYCAEQMALEKINPRT